MSKREITAANVMKPFSAFSAHALVKDVRAGIPTAVVRAFIEKSGLDREQLLRALHISSRTLERRADTVLDATQSDRFLRIKRVYDFALEVLGSQENVVDWMQGRIRALGGEIPIEFLDTEIGARAVRNILGRIAWGIFS